MKSTADLIPCDSETTVSQLSDTDDTNAIPSLSSDGYT